MNKRETFIDAELPTVGTVIRLPDDPQWQAELVDKARDYKARLLAAKESAWLLRESGREVSIIPETTQEYYGREIIKQLVQSKVVVVENVEHALRKIQGTLFDANSFNTASIIVFQYTQNRTLLQERLR